MLYPLKCIAKVAFYDFSYSVHVVFYFLRTTWLTLKYKRTFNYRGSRSGLTGTPYPLCFKPTAKIRRVTFYLSSTRSRFQIPTLLFITSTQPKGSSSNYTLERSFTMKQGDIITLSNGEKATITMGDENDNFKNIYVVQLENGKKRVVDRKTLSLASMEK